MQQHEFAGQSSAHLSKRRRTTVRSDRVSLLDPKLLPWVNPTEAASSLGRLSARDADCPTVAPIVACTMPAAAWVNCVTPKLGLLGPAPGADPSMPWDWLESCELDHWEEKRGAMPRVALPYVSIGYSANLHSASSLRMQSCFDTLLNGMLQVFAAITV